MTVILIHCIFLKKEFTHQSDTTKYVGGFQYNVPDPRTSECCKELGAWRCEFILLALEYQEPEFSKNVEAAVLMFC